MKTNKTYWVYWVSQAHEKRLMMTFGVLDHAMEFCHFLVIEGIQEALRIEVDNGVIFTGFPRMVE